MTGESVLIPFRCGKTTEEWTAKLERIGSKFAFVSFLKEGTQHDLTRPDREADFARRLRDLLVQVAPLPPQPNADLVTETRPRNTTDKEISEYGFICPTCRDVSLVLCPECTKYSCGNAVRDSAGRFLCPWCSATLVNRPLTDEERRAREVPHSIDSISPRTELRYRELPPSG
jgi:hypothetical protein